MTTAPRRRAGVLLFLLSLTIYLFTAGGSMTSTDAVVAFDLARNIVEEGTVATSGDLLGLPALRGSDGRFYSPFGLAQSIYDIPFYVAGRSLAAISGLDIGKPDTIPKAFVAMSQTLVGALITWQIFVLALQITGDPRASLMAAVTCAFGSLLWPYALFGFGQPLACATLLASVTRAHRGVSGDRSGDLLAAGAWFAVSLMTRHEMGLAAIVIGGWILAAGAGDLRARVRRVAAFLPGVVAGALIWLGYNALRFGHPLDSGHLRDPVPGFGSPIADGLLGLLFSPAASLFLYSPFAIAGAGGLILLARRDRASAALCASLVLAFLVFYASLGNWLGGRSYGGRYLLVILPYLGVGWAVVLAALRGRALATAFAAVTLLGAAIQVPGVLLDYAKVSQAAQEDGRAFSTEERQWSWRASPLVLNAAALPGAISDNIAYVAGRQAPPAVAAPAGEADRSFSQQFAFSLDLWWLYLFYMGVVPRAGVLAIVTVFLAVSLLAAMRLRAAGRAAA